MKNLLVVLILLLSACSQNMEAVKRNSLDDVFFYLSNYNIVKNTSQLKLNSFCKIGKKKYELRYLIDNNESLWIVHYYDESEHLSYFMYEESKMIDRITDSINKKRINQQYYPLSKRWDGIFKAPERKR